MYNYLRNVTIVLGVSYLFVHGNYIGIGVIGLFFLLGLFG